MGGASSSKQVEPSETPTFFTQEELIKLKSTFETGGVKNIKPLIQQKLTELDNTELNIAVTGEAGTGKSTFINAMRGLKYSDEGAAEVGNIETTTEPSRYPHPSLPNVCFWDLPGIGTRKFEAHKYLKAVQFQRYDFFIIIADCRLRENDIKLVKEIQKMGKNFYFVRSKIDNDLDSMRKQRGNINDKEELKDIRKNHVSELREAGIPDPSVFLVSSLYPKKYDFILLNETLEHDLPNVKKSIFVLALPNLNIGIVQKKSEVLKKRVWMLATLSGTVGAIPVPGVSLACDISILIGGIIHFRKCLGLDDASLQRLANRADIPVNKMKAELKHPLLGEINKDLITRLSLGTAVVAVSAVEIGLYAFPVLGSIFGAGSSFLMTYTILSDALKVLTEHAERVVKVAFLTIK
ncbi:interferon-inducible GTPase 5-like [Pristis pectinata]|uniref:interferon-inducible GTPase 5-like n=1 Tax=Pristis pectinata TaxID=685728 RepID=UPI00223D7FAF|nr:interferon-inducible GTPase 5-like [Pristis pectinata]